MLDFVIYSYHFALLCFRLKVFLFYSVPFAFLLFVSMYLTCAMNLIGIAKEIFIPIGFIWLNKGTHMTDLLTM